MERNVRPEITHQTSNSKHTGVARDLLDDRILCLDAAGAETGIREEIYDSTDGAHI